MGSKLYVGGLPYAATEPQLTSLSAEHGTVESARVITGKFTGKSRGFGFVEMSTAEEAKAAITGLNGSQMDGRSLTVNEATPMELSSGGGGGRGSRRTRPQPLLIAPYVLPEYGKSVSIRIAPLRPVSRRYLTNFTSDSSTACNFHNRWDIESK